VPLLSDHLYGVVPPFAARFAVYAFPTWPLGSEPVVTATADGVIVRESVTDLLCTGWLESVTLKVSEVAFAEVVGVPLMRPALDKLSPPGKVPLVSDHWYGVVPPVAFRVAEYVVPTLPLGSVVVGIARLWGFGLGAASTAHALRRMQIKATELQTKSRKSLE
jgi:hypothetical protein